MDTAQQIKKRVQRLARKDRKKWLHDRLEENQDPSGRKLWQQVRTIRKGYTPKCTRMIDQ